MADPKESASQDNVIFVDTGEESISVDSNVVSGEIQESAPAKVEEKIEATPATIVEETPIDKGGEETDDLKDFKDESDPKGVQKKIGVLTKKFKTEETARQTVEADNAALRAENEALKLAKETGPDLSAPDINNFDTEAEYYEALTDYKVDLKFAEQSKVSQEKADEAAKITAEQAQIEQGKRIQAALADGPEKHSDFNEVIKDVQIPTDMMPVFESLDNAADVAYALGKNPAKVAEISRLHPSLAGIELQKISNNLKTNKKTNAPDPITPVSTIGSPIQTLNNMGTKDYRKARTKQMKDRGR